MTDLRVERYSIYLSDFRPASGDYLRVGDVDLGDVSDIVDAEYRRAGSAARMRPMFYTGSPYGAELLKLAKQVRGETLTP